MSDVLAAVLTREPDWSTLPSATHASVRQLLRRCLERDPRKRLRDIGEAALLLASAGSETGNMGPAVSTPNPRSQTRERVAWGLAAVGLVLAVSMAGRSAWSRPEAGAAGALYFSVSTAPSEGAPTAAVISPDGTRVAFLGRLPDTAITMIFVLDLRESEPRALGGTEGATGFPAFSPDGKWLSYISHHRKLRKVPTDGGTPVDLATGDLRYAQVAWMDNGSLALASFDWEHPGVLYEVPETGGTPTPLPAEEKDNAEAATYPKPLPGVRAVLLHTGRDRTSLAVQSLDTGKRKALAPNARFAQFVGGSVVWLENDRMMAAPFDLGRLEFTGAPTVIQTDELSRGGPIVGFNVASNGSLIYRRSEKPARTDDTPEAGRRLIWVDRSGARTPAAVADANAIGEPRLSPDGARVLVDGATGDSLSDVWSVDLERGAQMRLSFTDGEDETGVWSPDGKWIAWAGSRTGQGRALYRRRSDGSGKEEKLWDSAGLHFHAGSWTADGQGVLVTVDSPKTGFDIFLLTLDPASVAKPILTGPHNETSVRLSPDGRWIAYASDESGRSEIYVQAFPDLGSKIQISLAGGQEPVWRPSGRELVYRSSVSSEFMSVNVEAKGALVVSPPKVLASDKGLTRGEMDHTAYAVARDGRLLAVPAPPARASFGLGFVLGWAQSVGLVK